MPGIAFTNLAMLAGLVALSVPVIIHLLLRRKKKRLRFSSIRFFLQRDERSSQRRKLQNWLLLALRLLICALLVFAFARPFLRNSAQAGAGQQPRRVVLVLDRSLSMQANAANGPKWTQAIDAARQVLGGLAVKDRVALVSCGPRAEAVVEWAPPAMVDRALNDLRPTCGGGKMADALQLASRLISVAEAQASSTVWVISDLQRSTCADIDSARLPNKTELKIKKIGDLLTPNLAITDLLLQSNEGLPPHVSVTSYSDEDARDLEVKVAVDGELAANPSLSVRAGSSTNYSLALPFSKPGWHDVRVQVQAHDALALDNTRYGVVFVPRPARVLVAETRPGQHTFDQASFFVSAALDPSTDSTNALSRRYAVESVPPDDVARRLAAAKSGELPCELVILPGLPQVPSALGKALANYVREGGGAFLFLGDGISANRYNLEFRGLLPARLGDVQSSPDWDSAWRIGKYTTNLTVFGAFQGEHSGDLSLARFTRRLAMEGADPASVAARFQDDAPFLVTGTVGEGRVVLVNTSVDSSWNDWPKHKTYVPWIHGTAKYLLPRANENTWPEDPALSAGSIADLETGATPTNGMVKLQSPDGTVRTLKADGHGQLRDVTFPTPGVYVLQDSSGHELRRLAVNLPAAESDLSSWGGADFEQRVARAPEEPMTLGAGLLGVTGNQRELWRVLLLTVLGLLMVELVVANRTVV